MGRKVFISVLGATNYRCCDYQKNGVSYGNERFVQVSTMRYLNCANWSKDSVAYILLTKGSEDNNWVDDGQIDFTTKERVIQSGLKTELERMHLPFPVEAIVNLPDGNDESEIWNIFERVFEKIEVEDELYFDITHGFRYLPMLILVLCNYSKFLKKVTIKSITYGNYEVARTIQHGLIVDLLPLAQLQDWTYAAGQYIDNGNVDRLCELAGDEYATFSSALKDVVGERETCRGIDIISSAKFKDLVESIEKLECDRNNNPILPIIKNVKSSFEGFSSSENIHNGLQASVWCYENHLYQQSITILLETIISDVCQKNGFDWKTRKYRDYVVSIFIIVKDSIPKSGWKYKEKEGNKLLREKECLEKIFESDIIKEWYDIYTKTDELRNDINHAGMRNNAKSKSDFIREMDGIMVMLKNKLSC